MRIVPIINADFISRYQRQGKRVVDTLTNRSINYNNESTAQALLDRLNKIGMLNGHIIDHNVGLPTSQQAQLLYVVA